MKYALLLLLSLVHTNVLSYNNDAYAKVYELAKSSQHNRYNRGSNNLYSTISSNDANFVKALLELAKQVLVAVGVAEAVKHTGSGSQAVQQSESESYATQQSDDILSYGLIGFNDTPDQNLDNRSLFGEPIVSLPPYYKFITEESDAPTHSHYTTAEHIIALKYLFGVSYPSSPAIDRAIECIAQEAIRDDTFIHLPTMRSIVEDHLHYLCGEREKDKFIRTFFKSETGLLTKFAVSQFGQKIKVPYVIYQSQNQELLTKLHDIAYHLEYCDGTYIVEACRAVEYLKGALLDSDQAYRRSCHMLFDAYYRLVMGHGCTALVELADLTKTGCRSFKKELQREIVHTVAQFCEATTDTRLLTEEEQALVNRQAAGLVNNVNNVVAQLKEVDLVLSNRKKKHLETSYKEGIQGYVDRVLPRITSMQEERRAEIEQAERDRAQEAEREHRQSEQVNYIQERTAQYHVARQEALIAYTDSTAVAEPLSDAAHKLLVRHECSPELFSVDLGTPVQKALQHEFVSIVNTAAELPPLNNDQLGLLLRPTVAHLAEVGASYTLQNNLDKATTLADCCWAALDCVVAAGEGVVDGGLNTGKSLYTLVRHPVQSITSTVNTLAHLGYHLGKVLYEVGDISVSYVVDPDQGAQKWTTFSNKLRVVYDAVTDKIKTTPPRELIKGASSIITETLLTGKCLKAVVPLFAKALEKAEQVTQIIERTLDLDNNFQMGDGVIAVGVLAADTVTATTAAHATQVLGQVLERGGQVYAMAGCRDSNIPWRTLEDNLPLQQQTNDQLKAQYEQLSDAEYARKGGETKAVAEARGLAHFASSDDPQSTSHPSSQQQPPVSDPEEPDKEDQEKEKADKPLNNNFDNKSQSGHIFQNKPGHLPDTPANRAALLALANDAKSYMGTDQWGVGWYVKVLDHGKQLWVRVWNGIITDGGLNEDSLPWNPVSGLSKLYKPK